MILTRRQVLMHGGAAVGVGFGPLLKTSSQDTIDIKQDIIDIKMSGRRDGSHVWFDPLGIHISVGQTIRWTNVDPGNAHTATAYHPENGAYPLRIPHSAEPWDSGYLLPGRMFSVTFMEQGVYDYFCIPHRLAGMVGRIVVGHVEGSPYDDLALPKGQRNAFPSVESIVTEGLVRAS